MLKSEQIDDATKHLLDALSVVTVIGALVDVLPSIAALFTIAWTGIRIYETKTVQSLLGKEKSDEEGKTD